LPFFGKKVCTPEDWRCQFPCVWQSMLSSLRQPFFIHMQFSIIVVGIDGAGKSTVINHVKAAGIQRTGEQVPTVGCAVEELRHGNVQLTVFDMAGGSKYRSMWSNYYNEVNGIVYVIDSADAMRMCALVTLSLSFMPKQVLTAGLQGGPPEDGPPEESPQVTTSPVGCFPPSLFEHSEVCARPPSAR
jgi:GTPase SAR1 family protein